MFLVAVLLAAGCPSPRRAKTGSGDAANTTPSEPIEAIEDIDAGVELASAKGVGASGAPQEIDAAYGNEVAVAQGAAHNVSTAHVEAPAGNAPNTDGGGYGHTSADDKDYPPLFEGWPQPDLTLFFTGRQYGYIEPCGCTGLANQKGGLNRRHTFIQRLEKRGWNPVPIDIGNQIRRFGRQPEVKFQSTIAGLKSIGYQAIAFGPDDLRISGGELLAAAIGTDGEPAPFVAANVNILDQTPPLRVIETAGKKIGVTAILGKEEQRGVANPDVTLSDPDDKLAELLPKLKETKCDIYVLLSHTSIEQSRRLGAKFPIFDLVVTAGSAGEPAHRLEPIEGTDGHLVQIGIKGMYVSVVGVFDDERQRFRMQRAPLDGRFPDSRDMLDLMASYQQQLEAMGLAGLAIKPHAHPSGRKFVGTSACADCHYEEYEIWKETPHAHGTDSLTHPGERSEIPRHHDPECLSCHVTGWNPQEYFPYESGYLSLDKTPHMKQSGCENCHGPGSLHVAAENGEIDGLTDELQEKYRQQMVLKLEDARNKCLECHDLDNSPDFHSEGAFEEYWERVAH